MIVEEVPVRTGTSITCVFARHALQETRAVKVCTLLSSSHCTVLFYSATEMVTFGGNGYAQYSLINTRSSRTRRQAEPLSATTIISSFQENILLRFRTMDSSGLLLLLDSNEDSDEHFMLKVSSLYCLHSTLWIIASHYCSRPMLN